VKDKPKHLKEHGVLNRQPKAVKARLFLENPFFDPRDLIQVKYEMLRAVEKDGLPVSQAADHFGLSRPTFYDAQRAMRTQGLTGLIPKKTGPKTRHKLTPEVLAFVHAERAKAPKINAQALAQRIKKQFSLTVHPRSIERALTAQKKTAD
jgi:transposase